MQLVISIVCAAARYRSGLGDRLLAWSESAAQGLCGGSEHGDLGLDWERACECERLWLRWRGRSLSWVLCGLVPRRDASTGGHSLLESMRARMKRRRELAADWARDAEEASVAKMPAHPCLWLTGGRQRPMKTGRLIWLLLRASRANRHSDHDGGKASMQIRYTSKALTRQRYIVAWFSLGAPPRRRSHDSPKDHGEVNIPKIPRRPLPDMLALASSDR